MDEAKLKGDWSLQEDLIILNHVYNHGRKWSQLAHSLGDTRTEHMAKNRFHSLINENYRIINQDAPRRSRRKHHRAHGLAKLFDNVFIHSLI